MRKGMLILGAILSMTPMLSQSSSYSLPDDRVSLLGQLEKGGARLISRKSDGKLVFIGTSQGNGLSLPSSEAQPGVSAPSPDIHIDTWAPLLGVKNPSKQLSLSGERHLKDGRKVIRYRQMVSGLPVVGGDLVMNLSKDNKLLSLGGKLSDVESIDTAVSVSANSAASIAVKAVSKWYGMAENKLEATTPELSVLDAKLLRPDSQPERMVWRLEVMPKSIAPIKEFLLVDAKSGVIVLHFNQVHGLKNRLTYSSLGTDNTQHSLVCNESSGDACSGGSDTDADAAHIHAGDSYDFFFNHHGRDSLDDAGMAIISNVDWDDGASCPNAFWWNNQMYYCDTLSLSDDIVGHELTHGVTENTSNLFYYYQSGAINEALSDIWGEFIDLENGRGSDEVSDRWLMGEDATAFGGAIRSMSNPPLYGDPDKMTSSNYYTQSDDNGGVHYNSGIANKAAYLMVDGGTFNGYTVSPLGISKTSAIFYEAQTNLLTSGSDYAFLHEALYQGCQTLIGGVDGIALDDCSEVRKATLAVEMDYVFPVDFMPQADICPNDNVVTSTLFSDDFESGSGQWEIIRDISGDSEWQLGSINTLFGSYEFDGLGSETVSDESLAVKSSIALPSGLNAHLVFKHGVYLEETYDAGLVEYSLDNGVTWYDAGSLIVSGQAYNGIVDTRYGSPVAGASAFTGDSHGYVSSRLDFGGFTGESIRFRFRLATDAGVMSPGWFIDDVSVVICNREPTANAGKNATVLISDTYTLNGSSSRDPDAGDSIASYLWEQTGGTAVTLSSDSVASPSFTAPDTAGEAMTFRLTVTDTYGASGVDSVVITTATTLGGGGGGGDALNWWVLVSLLGLWSVKRRSH